MYVMRILILITVLCGCCHPQMIKRDEPILIMKNLFNRQSDIMRMLQGLEMQMNTTREGFEKQVNATREGIEIQMNATREGMEKQLNATMEEMEMQIDATREGLAEKIDDLETVLESSQQNAEASTTRILDSMQKLDNKWTYNQLPQLETLIEESVSEVEGRVSDVNVGINGLEDGIIRLESALKSSQEKASSDIKDTITEVSKKIKGLIGRVFCLTEDDKYRLTSRCYHFSDYTWTWSDAKSYCRKHGGYLVRISTEAEFSFINDNTSADRWIGLSDVDTEGEYKWTFNGASHDPSSHKNWWEEGEPNNANSNEDCIELRHSSKKLNDADCSVKKRPICEFNGIAVD